MIKERLSKAYPSREWDELTDLEKQTFKLVTMKDYLIKNSQNSYKVERKIKTELESTLYSANKALVAHNDYIETLYRQFFDENASEKENYSNYLQFREKLRKH